MPSRFAALAIVLCWCIYLAYWLFTACSVKRTAERQNPVWLGVRIAVVLVAILLFRNVGPLSPYTSQVLWSYTPTVGMIATLVSLAGLTVMLWARTILGRNWSGAVTFKEQHELVEQGPYRYIRHPIYSGLLMLVLGVSILGGSAGGFAAFVVILLWFWFKAHQEERLLAKHFPEEYPRYRARVKGFVPLVW
jgi:protein-S-isoprenylcysteine O-methyltransferase Ste14